jgi:hypothetical protein
MAYQEWGLGPPHFDGKNYQMWSKRMVAFLRGKSQILWDVTMDTSYVQLMNFLAPGSRDMFDANNKEVDYLFRALCQPEFDRVHCRMDLPGPTTSVGTRTDYSVGPWDYPACATRHLKAWSTRTTQE